MALLLAEGEEFVGLRRVRVLAEQRAAAIDHGFDLEVVRRAAALQRREARGLDEVAFLLGALDAGRRVPLLKGT
jgi:hypothetical protein